MGKALKDTPWPVLLLVLSFLCPTELSLYLGSARLPPHRALLLLLLPFAVLALFGRRGIRPKAFDIAFLAFAAWTIVIYVYHHGQADGLQSGGAMAIDCIGSFLVGRAFVRDARAFAGTATALFLAVVAAGIIALPETLTGQIYVHDLLRQLTGYVHPTAAEKRLGLTRAFGTFDHPIHLGTFCASGLALAIYSSRRDLGAVFRGFAIAASALLSLSSAPMLSLGAQVAFGAAERMTRGIKGRVYLGLAAFSVLFGALSLVATRSPFALIATGLTLDPWTGYYRLMIWHHGMLNVLSNAWMGLGLNDWERPQWMASPTIDAFWLVIGVRGGIPHLLMLIAGIVLLARGIGVRMRHADADSRRLATGWMISLIALALVGCTVHYWNVPYAYFFFFLGLGGCMADPLRKPATAAAPAKRREAEARGVRWVTPGELPQLPALANGAARWPVPVLDLGASPAGPWLKSGGAG